MSASSTSSAVSGMRVAELRLETSAGKVAGAGYLLVRVDQASRATPAGGAPSMVRNGAAAWLAAGGAAENGGSNTEVDLGAEALEQAEARTSFMANAKVLQVSQEMVKRLFELTDGD